MTNESSSLALVVVSLCRVRASAVRRHRPREPGASRPHRRAHAAGIQHAAGAVPHHRADVARARCRSTATGCRPSAFNGPDATSRPVRRSVDPRPEQRRSVRGPLLHRPPARWRSRARCSIRYPPSARRAVENGYATIEMTDSVAVIGAHQVALIRGYSQQLQDAVQALERDVTNPRHRVSPGDRAPRQSRRRRAARPSPGHGDEPAAVARPRAAAGARQAHARHGGREHEHAAAGHARRPSRRHQRRQRRR